MSKKEILLLIVVLTLTSQSSFAQFNWGVRTGVQYSKVHFNKNSGANFWKGSYLIPGIYFEQSFNKRTAISFDIQFAIKGFSNFGTGYVKKGESTIDLSYFTFPILFHYKPLDALSIFAGPEFGLKTGSSVVIDGERIEDKVFFTNTFDFGVSGGLSYQFLPGYSLMLRYTHGLANILDMNARFYDLDGRSLGNARELGYKFYNQAFQVSLSSRFNISKDDKKTVVLFGLRQGISTYTLSGSGIKWKTNSSKSINERIGYEAGIDMRFPIKKYFFTSVGLSYSQKGGQVEGDELVKLNYVSLPIMFGVSPIKSSKLTLSVEGGIGIDKEISSSNPYENYSPSVFTSFNYPITGTYIYGFEASTDVSNKLTIFLSYRNMGRSTFLYWFTPGNADDYEFMTKGNSISLGVRLRHDKGSVRQAHVNDDNHSVVGMKGGLNFNRMVYKNLPAGVDGNNNGVKLGAHLGMYFKIRLGKRLSFSPELQYIQKQTHFSAIETPLMFAYIIDSRFTFETGPQLSILFNRKPRTIGVYKEYIDNILDDGWNIGLQYKLSPKVSLGCRYYYGFLDISGWGQNNGISLPTEGFNRNLLVSTYYMFNRK